MALQTKVYTQTSNTFTLELTLTENSVSTSGNSSSITYTLKLKSTTKDFSQYGVGATVVLDGKTVAERNRGSSPQLSLGTYSSITLFNGTTSVGHNTDGSKSMSVKFTLDMASASWTPGNMSKTDTMALTKIARKASITSAPNFNDDENPVVKISNPANATVQLAIYKDSYNAIADYRTITGTSYTFNLTSAERTKLRQVSATSNTAQVRYYIKSVIGGRTYIDFLTKTLTIRNPAPTINPTITDSNSTTVALTGSADKLVKGYSNAAVVIGAAAVKEARLVSKKVTCGGESKTTDGTFSKVTSGTFDFEAKDSRGNVTRKTVTKTLINYFPPTCNIGGGSPNYAGNFNFKISGAVFNANFGVSSNSLTAQYRYKKQRTQSWSPWKSMSVHMSSNSYTATASVSSLDSNESYEFQARVTDKLATVESPTKVFRCRPGLELLEDGANVFGTLYLNDVPLLDVLFPVNSIYLTATNTNPGNTLGGTWQSTTSPASGIYAWVRKS